jgi:hypothetical protein
MKVEGQRPEFGESGGRTNKSGKKVRLFKIAKLGLETSRVKTIALFGWK